MNEKLLATVLTIAWVVLLCTGCSSDGYVGNEETLTRNDAISFNGGTGKTTRAVGADAAAMLENSFVVYGCKTLSDGGTKQKVFDYYTVNYTPNSAQTTTTNSNGWEYVAQSLNMLSQLPAGAEQEIKYWDHSATQYDFIAFSLGGALQTTAEPTGNDGKVKVSRVDMEHLTDAAFTIKGKTDDIANVYVADRVKALPTTVSATSPDITYRNTVNFNFRALAAKVRIGLYETIPGYSVKDVKFYQQPSSPEAGDTPYLYAGTQTIPDGMGTVTVSFPVGGDNPSVFDYHKSAIAYSGDKVQSLRLGALTADAAPQFHETGGSIYLGRTSMTASMTADVSVIPVSADALTLKVDFTLQSVDYNEEIHVKGATAVVPSNFTIWHPNHSYTYIFKLSDAVTNAFGQVLYPITFDAYQTIDDVGHQQTITTMDQPSITTYAKGEVNGDYYVGDNIYVSVAEKDGSAAKVLNSDNAKLYTVTLAGGMKDADITEINIKDGKVDITLTPVDGGFMTFTKTIDANDSSTGQAVTASGNIFAKFTANKEIYVFEYTDSDDKKYYKVIRVGTTHRPLTLPDIPEVDI